MNESITQVLNRRRILRLIRMERLGAVRDGVNYTFKSGHRINDDVINLFTRAEWNEFIGMIEKLELVN